MPYRKTNFVNGNFYHVINRGVNHDAIFKDEKDYRRFLDSTNFSRFDSEVQFSYFNRISEKARGEMLERFEKTKGPLVDILVFSLMPNHYHYLMRQLLDGGVQTFMRNFQNSYAKFFNIKHERIGPLFQSAFRATPIESEEQLVHTSRYIHLNQVSSSLVEITDLEKYPWTSFPEYLGKKRYNFVNTKPILEFFDGDRIKYKKFVFEQADNQKELQIIKNQLN